VLYPEPQYNRPSEMAAPDRHEPPLSKVHRMAPVAPLRAYMCPVASSEHPKTTPFAVVTGPEDAPPKGDPPNVGTVCHSSWPVTASMPLHTPLVVVVPFGRVHGTPLLFALAV
jgi:hypothetical protein